MGKRGSMVVWLFAAFAGVSLGLGVLNAVRKQMFLSQAELATGTITDYELYVRPDGLSEYCPRIEFTTLAGEFRAVRGSICPNEPDDSKIGQTQQIYYDPQQPDHYEVKTPTAGYDGLILGLIGAVFFGGIAIFTRVFERRKAQARPGQVTPLMRQDAEKYRANQRKREHQSRHDQQDGDAP
jgi:hypothetical protein